MQGDAGHPGCQGGGPEKNNRKKWIAKEEERHKGLLTSPLPHPQKIHNNWQKNLIKFKLMGMRYDLDYRCVCTSYNRVDKDGHDKEDKNEEHQLEKTDIGQSLVLRKKTFV
jgi:hypothetical protein